MKRVAILLALLPSGSTPALARGGAHVEMHVGPNSARSAPSTIAAHGDSPLMGGPFPSSTGVGGMPDPGAPFNPSGVGVPGGNGPGNTTITPNMTPPPVNTGPTGPGARSPRRACIETRFRETRAGTGPLLGRWFLNNNRQQTGSDMKLLIATTVALFAIGSTLAAAQGGGGGAGGGAAGGGAAGGASGTATGSPASPSGGFNPGGVGVPGGAGPGNTTATPNMTPPAVNTGPTGPGGTFATPGTGTTNPNTGNNGMTSSPSSLSTAPGVNSNNNTNAANPSSPSTTGTPNIVAPER